MSETTADPWEDGTLVVPHTWTRRVIVAFLEPNPEGKTNPANVVVVREPLRQGETVHSLVEKLLLDMRDQPAFRVLEHRVFERNGANAVTLAYAWVNELGPIRQTTTFLATLDEHAPTVTSATTTCAHEDAEAMMPEIGRAHV